MSRWKASLLHLAISALVVALVLALILGVWYPPPYFGASGADTLATLIIGVDLVVGPLLTLIVFDTRKKSLRFDLTTIGVLQLAALIYGLHILYISRPVFLVAEREFITVVYANEVDPAPAPNAIFKKLPIWGPELVGLQVPDDPATRSRLLELMLTGKGEVRYRLAAYTPFEQTRAELLANSRPISELAEKELGLDDAALEGMRFVPVHCRAGDLVMLLDPDGNPLRAVKPVDRVPRTP